MTYFELGWSILSSIGLFVTFVGVWALFISRPSPLTYIPIVVSVSCAVANGACYYAFYTEYATANRAVASAFADFFWLVRSMNSSSRLRTRSKKQVFLSTATRSSSTPSATARVLLFCAYSGSLL